MEIAFTRIPYCRVRGKNERDIEVIAVPIELAFSSHSSGQVFILETGWKEIEKIKDQTPSVILLPAFDTKEVLSAISVLKKILTSSWNDHLK